MSFTWLDGILLAFLLGIMLYEARQEFGCGLLDTVAVLGALHLATRLAAVVSPHLTLLARPEANQGAWLGICFALLLVAGYFLSRFAHSITRWTMDAMDPFFGLAFGLAIGLVLGHGCARALAGMLGTPDGAGSALLGNSALVDELLHFRSLDAALAAMERYQHGG